MQTNSYLNRVKPLLSNGIKTGAVFGFLGSLIYTILLVSLLFFGSLLFSPPIPQRDSVLLGSFAIGSVICIITVVPSTIIGIIGGVLVSCIIAIWGKRISNISASFIGLTVGIILALIVNYLIWRTLYFGVYAHDSFADFIFPINVDFIDFSINQNPFFVPSIIAILLSAFGAWWINKEDIVES